MDKQTVHGSENDPLYPSPRNQNTRNKVALQKLNYKVRKIKADTASDITASVCLLSTCVES